MTSGRSSANRTWIKKGNCMEKKKRFVLLDTYIFGSDYSIIVETEHTVEEIKNDWGLRERLINEGLAKASYPQDYEPRELSD